VWPLGLANTVCPRRPLTTQVHIGPRQLRLITWPCDLDLWPWTSWRLWLMRVIVLHQYTVPSMKFVGLAVRKIWCTMCVSIHVPGDPDLWSFDLETGMRVASKVGNLPSKSVHTRPLASEIIHYVRDGRMDGWTKAMLNAAFPMGGGIITIYQMQICISTHSVQ